MQALNSILLEGNLVRDPTVSQTPRGTSVCNFSIASNRTWKSGETYEKEVSYFNVEAWGKLGEVTAKNCSKGRGVRIVGRLKQSRWIGNDGKNYSKVYVIADHVEFKPVINKKPVSEVEVREDPEDAFETVCDTVEQEEAVPVF